MREGVAAKVDPTKLAEMTAAQRKAAETGLAKEAANLKDSGVKMGSIAAEGDPADAINTEAAKVAETLIVISTHGRSGVGRWVMGSVTDKKVREANHATLVIRSAEGDVASAAPRISRVVLAVDGSETGERAISHAIEMAKALGTGITVLRAIPPTAFGDTFAEYVPAAYDDLYAEVEADAQQYASKIAQ
jgi:nucleotide-binding universal stress UspA family protein